jgi:glutathione reductase (NADPH)
MSEFDVDLVVIGAGSGGVRAARIAARHGARVLLAEEFRVGGTCVIRGCVPKKLLVYASRFNDLFSEAPELGWPGLASEFDWPTLVAGKNRVVTRLEGLYTQSQHAAGVEIVKSRAVIEDLHTVRLLSDGRLVRARTILVATGARPELPAWEGVELGVTSNEIFDLPRFPARVVVAGAGYIGMEFAGLFAGLGSNVTVVCRGDTLLRGFDGDLQQCLTEEYQDRGIKLLFTDVIASLESSRSKPGGDPDAPIFVATQNGARLVADQVIIAVGRVANTAGLGLERVGVRLESDGRIIVDANSRTNVDNIYAVGDASSRYHLTPVAIREGHAFADSVFGNKPWTVDYNLVPTVVFTTPEVATVGLTELQARAAYAKIDVYQRKFRAPPGAASGSCRATLVKIVVDGESRRIVGVHLFANEAGEMLQGITLAVGLGATFEEFMDVMVIHPTLGEELGALREPTVSYDSRKGPPPRVEKVLPVE